MTDSSEHGSPADRGQAPTPATTDQAPAAAYAVEPQPVRAASPGPDRSPGGFGRGPALALFVGGFLTCLGLVLSTLALNGTIRPASPAAVASPSAVARASPPASASASPAASAAATLPPVAAPSVVTPVDLADGRALGKKTAPVTVELWEDFQCPFCQRFTEQVEPQLVSTYIATGKVRLVYRDYAFLGQESFWAEIAARLADQQGKFWPYHDYLYANQGAVENEGAFAPARLLQVAVAVGLDQATYSTCISDTATLQQVNQSHQQGIGAGVSGTPTIFINSQVQSAYDLASLSTALDKAYGNATPAPLPSGAATPSSSPAASPST